MAEVILYVGGNQVRVDQSQVGQYTSQLNAMTESQYRASLVTRDYNQIQGELSARVDQAGSVTRAAAKLLQESYDENDLGKARKSSALLELDVAAMRQRAKLETELKQPNGIRGVVNGMSKDHRHIAKLMVDRAYPENVSGDYPWNNKK